MKNTLFSIAILTGIFLVSCNSSKKADNQTTADMHTSENSLDWQGTYYGVTPCASCPGIETELTLTTDLNYILTQVYIDEEENKYTSEGKFNWNGNNIELEGAEKDKSPWAFKVEENSVRQLDLQGNVVEGDMASNYLLTKTGNLNVEDKRWKLTEINGKPVEGSAETHYIIFHSDLQRIEAKANCNLLNFAYTIRNQFQLITEQGISTMMACPEDDGLESEMIEAINTTDNISITESGLFLNKARMAPLAKFELAE